MNRVKNTDTFFIRYVQTRVLSDSRFNKRKVLTSNSESKVPRVKLMYEELKALSMERREHVSPWQWVENEPQSYFFPVELEISMTAYADSEHINKKNSGCLFRNIIRNNIIKWCRRSFSLTEMLLCCYENVDLSTHRICHQFF